MVFHHQRMAIPPHRLFLRSSLVPHPPTLSPHKHRLTISHRLISLGTLSIFIKVGRDVFHADRNFHRFVSPQSPRTPRPSLPICKVSTVEIQSEIVPLERSLSRQD